jgi:hypothetical protein
MTTSLPSRDLLSTSGGPRTSEDQGSGDLPEASRATRLRRIVAAYQLCDPWTRS